MYVFVVGVCNNDIKINFKKEKKKTQLIMNNDRNMDGFEASLCNCV